MDADRIIEVLCELHTLQGRCLASRLVESTAFVSGSAVEEMILVRRLADDGRKHAAELASRIIEFDGVPPLPTGDVTSAELHFLDLRSVLPRLLADGEALAGAYAAAAQRLADEPEIAGMVTRMLGVQREHVNALRALCHNGDGAAD